MTEVKVSYYPLRCRFGHRICEHPNYGCVSFDDPEEQCAAPGCKNGSFGEGLCVYNKRVSNFEFDGVDAYGNFYFAVGKKEFASWNCEVHTLEVDGKIIVDNTQEAETA